MSRQDYSLRRRQQAAVDFRTRSGKKPERRTNLDDPLTSLVNPRNEVIGLAALKVLGPNALRSGYRVYNLLANTGTIYHDYDDTVSAVSPDYILPGGYFQDAWDWQTVHQGEVWLISDVAAQTVRIEEVIVNPKWYRAYVQMWGLQ